MSTQVVLVTGATGFIGRHLVSELLSHGTTVRLIARAQAKALKLFGDRVEIVTGNVLDRRSLDEACRGVDQVYHVAGMYRFGPTHRRLCHSVNVEGTENVMAAASAASISKAVHVSSAGLLVSDREIADETGFPKSRPRFSPYKSSKWEAERRALAWAGRGLPVVIASPTCPIGAGDEYPTPTGRILLDFLRGRMPFISRTRLNFLSVEDLAQGLTATMSRGVCGERYILGGCNLYLEEFLEIVGAQTGLKAPKRTLPGPVILAAGVVAEVAGYIYPPCGDHLCLESAVQAMRCHFFQTTKARETLDWQCVDSIPSSIQRAVQWFRENSGTGLSELASPSLEPHVT